MKTTITIHGILNPQSSYVGWSPCPCEIRLTDAAGAAGPVTILLRNKQPANGGKVVFYVALPSQAADELQLVLPVDGSAVPFYTGGKFGFPSVADKDVTIEVIEQSTATVLSENSIMVRVRKNANGLTAAERDRFVAALAKLNNAGQGPFQNFRDMHVENALGESHRNAGFLPWHRAYLLDLERELQNIDPSVTQPYWRFDELAPNVFDKDFLGEADPSSNVQFSAGNPLTFWKTDSTPGIVRQPLFKAKTELPKGFDLALLTEVETLAIGDIFAKFTKMEGDPHGAAHVSFSGYLSDPATAPKDPMFFLLHANVDRLWAKWQWHLRRFDSTPASYEFTGKAGDPGAARIGHNLKDTMWPWNQNVVFPRPPTAPGGPLAPSPITDAPGPSPAIQAMIDYLGVIDPKSRIGAEYDDVPFEF